MPPRTPRKRGPPKSYRLSAEKLFRVSLNLAALDEHARSMPDPLPNSTLLMYAQAIRDDLRVTPTAIQKASLRKEITKMRIKAALNRGVPREWRAIQQALAQVHHGIIERGGTDPFGLPLPSRSTIVRILSELD